MALIKIREIFWRRNSPYGGYSANDVVSIYWNNVTLAINVQKNGSGISSGNDIPFHFQYAGNAAAHYKTETGGNQLEIDLVVCNGTTRLQFPRTISAFPYVQKVNLTGNPSCSVSPVVCDLAINSLPIVVNESSQGAGDGSITVTGSSSNGSIEYNLNNDFIYGSGSSSGVFSSLGSGTYRVFARDQANCSDSISITVSYDKVYATKYVLEYDDRVGHQSKIEIQERDYLGSSEEIKGGETPILIRQRGEGQQDKFVPVLGCEFDVTLTSEIKYQYQTLFTSDPNKYRVKFSKDFGSGYETLAITKLLPNQYREVYTDPPYAVNFLATDGLAGLKDVSFSDSSGDDLFGSYKSISIIAYCLKATGLSLNIRCAVNLYADGMAETDADDPLDQAYVDVESYYTDETLTYLDVIVRILEPFGAQLTQWGGVWNIVRPEEKTQEYDYREFDPSGVYISNSSFDPRLISQEKTNEGVIWVTAPEFEMNNAYGSISLTYNLGFRQNLIRNGDFKLRDTYNFLDGKFYPGIDFRGFQIVANGDDSAQGAYQVVDNNKIVAGQNMGTILPDKNNIALVFGAKGNAYLLSKPINLKLGFFDSLVFTIKCGVPSFAYQSYPYFKIRCVISYGTFYLTGDGRWTTNPTEVVFFATSFGDYAEFSVTSFGYPTGADAGLDLQVKVYHGYIFSYDVDSVADQRAIPTAGVITNATALVIGRRYQIRTIGTTDFTAVGAVSNTVGLQFYATGVGTGSGTALDEPLGIGYRTQRYDPSGNFKFYYYELQENTSAESVPDIVRPTDYNSLTNPVQWILVETRLTSYGAGSSFLIDKISVEYLSGGYAPPQKYETSILGEANNPNVLVKEVKHGSMVEIVKNSTIPINLIPTFFFFPPVEENQFIETVIENTELTYFGYFRDSVGAGFVNWHRSYVSESLALHDILLKSLAAQYNAPWRRMRGALTGADYVTPLNSIIEERDENKVYYPIALEIDDKNRVFSGEFVELSVVVTDDDDAGGDSDGVAFSNAFTTAFNS